MPISKGGTSANSAPEARTNLGLSTVAATGDFNDLINKPTIPATLTTSSVEVDLSNPAGRAVKKTYGNVEWITVRILEDETVPLAANANTLIYPAGALGAAAPTTEALTASLYMNSDSARIDVIFYPNGSMRVANRSSVAIPDISKSFIAETAGIKN